MKNHDEAELSDTSSDDLKSQTSNKCRIAAAYVTGAATQERSGSRVVTNPTGDESNKETTKKAIIVVEKRSTCIGLCEADIAMSS
jgi:hypothetical protein